MSCHVCMVIFLNLVGVFMDFIKFFMKLCDIIQNLLAFSNNLCCDLIYYQIAQNVTT